MGEQRGSAGRRRRPAGRDRRRTVPGDDVLAGSVEALAVLLGAGIAPESAWRYAGEEAGHPVVVRAARLIASGVPPAQALAQAAVRPARGGRDGGSIVGAASVSAAWSVAERSGAALAPALRGAAESLRDRAEAARDVETALAGPRATARLMAWLPLVGMAMSHAIGVDVLGALVGGPLGWATAAGGVVLLSAGRAWTSRLVRAASAAGPAAGLEHDLMAVALAGGMSVPSARATVSEAVRQAGVEATGDGSVDRVLRIAERAGAPAVELLSAEGRQERRRARADGRRRAEVLAVRLLLPLGVCVLPAFVLLGVVPVILAMLSSTFASLA